MFAIRRSHNSSHGFTLLEILVALTILAIIVTTVYGVLSKAIYAKNHSEERADLFASGREAVLRMADDIERALPPTAGMNGSVYFIGVAGKDRVPSDAIGFVMDVRRDVSGTQQRGGRAIVTYQLEPLKDTPNVYGLLRHEELLNNAVVADQSSDQSADQSAAPPGPVAMDAFIADEVAALRLRYLDPISGDWATSWDTTQPVPLGQRPIGLPGIVEITLYLADSAGNPVDFSTRVDLPLFVVPPTPVPGG